MPAPDTTSASVAVTDPAGSQPRATEIAALTANYQWGTATGAGVTLTFSFPWASTTQAVFSGPGGSTYTAQGEDQAAQRYGLNAVQQGAAASALRVWADVANLSFVQVADSATAVGDIRIAFSSALPSGTWGWAYGPYPDFPAGGDVWIATTVTDTTATKWAPGTRNHMSLMHEIGHALGLKHPFEEMPLMPAAYDNRRYTVMAYQDATGDLYPQAGTVDGRYDWITYQVLPQTPMLLDIAAIQHLYGPNLTHRTGNDTYTFDPAVPFFRTIWDAGGTDTLSAAGYTRGCVLDLRPGAFSSLRIGPPANAGGVTPTYDGTDNLAIAFGCIIENADGGSGADTLTGNDVGNRLSGAAGNDTLEGGAGNDTLTGGAGDDRLGGGTGIDTAIYGLARAALAILPASGGAWSVREAAGGSASATGHDTLTAIERLSLADLTLALDLAGNAGTVALVLGATLGRATVADRTLMGIGLYCTDTLGYDITQLTQLALSARLGANPTHGQVADLYYTHLVGVAPDPASRATLVGLMDSGAYTPATFGAAVAGLEATKAAIGYTGLAASGLAYLPFAG